MMYDVSELQMAVKSTTDMLNEAVEADKLLLAIVVTQGKDGRWNARRIGYTYNVYELAGFLEDLKLSYLEEMRG